MAGRADTILHLGGAACRLLYDYAAIERLQQEVGAPIEDVVVAAFTGTDLRKIAAIVAIGLERDHPEMTAERVFALSPALLPAQGAVTSALNQAFAGPWEGPADESPPLRLARRARTRFARLFGPRSAPA